MRNVQQPSKETARERKYSPLRCISVTARRKTATENCYTHPSGTYGSIILNTPQLPLLFQVGTSCSLLIKLPFWSATERTTSWQHLFYVKTTVSFLNLHTLWDLPSAPVLSTPQSSSPVRSGKGLPASSSWSTSDVLNTEKTRKVFTFKTRLHCPQVKHQGWCYLHLEQQ